jgi:hypothetical protein
MEILNARYTAFGSITALVDGVEMSIPADPANRHYAELIASGVEITPYAPPVMTVEEIRAYTAIDRAVFCNGLADAGVITDAEAIAAARGEWPSSFAGFLDYLNTTQSRDAQITWASCVTVERTHEFVLLLAWWKDMTDAQVDTLFGIAQQ